MTQDTPVDELEDFLRTAPDTRLMELLLPDMNGVLRGKRVGPDEFEDVLSSGINLCGSTAILNTKGATFSRVTYGSQDGDPDVNARAVAGSLAPMPWSRGSFGKTVTSRSPSFASGTPRAACV